MDPKKFARIAESLRQYRRADLREFQKELGGRPVDALYVDPLPNDAVLTSVLSSNTTFLLGRKGTGKSTVFARAQSALRMRRDVLTIYLDVKSLCELPNSQEPVIRNIESTRIDDGVLRAHLLRKSFLGAVISELLKEVEDISNEMSLWDSWTGKKKAFRELTEKLSALGRKTKEARLSKSELPVLEIISNSWKTRQKIEQGQKNSIGGKGALSTHKAELEAHASTTDFDKSLDDSEVYQEYSEAVLRSFPFDEIIGEIKYLLESSGLTRMVVFFDDFSELNMLDQKLFVDVVLSPLNNSSNERIKLKVAGYPGRVYYGKIDATKVDTICLDFASIYEATDVQSMEKSAIEYTKRLLLARFSAFDEDINLYFDTSIPLDEHIRLLFQCTFNVPRLMGSLLHICYLDKIAGKTPITAAALRLAARKYFETTVAQYFDRMNRFALEPFENKLDRHNQRQLLDKIVNEARDVRRKISDGSIGGTYFKRMGNPPTSHFVVNSELADMFRSLESNFFLSKYKDTRDKDGNAVIVYALLYGLVESERMSWGYPPGRDYRNYFVQRCFDYTAAIHSFLSGTQTIRCGDCGKSFPLDEQKSFELFKWRCPDCHKGICSIVNLADDFKKEVAQLKTNLMLEEVELAILETLDAEDRPMPAGEISGLIDATYQLVGHRTSKLRDLGLVDKRAGDDSGRVKSSITEKAKKTYFN